jgi:hypothetical protein
LLLCAKHLFIGANVALSESHKGRAPGRLALRYRRMAIAANMSKPLALTDSEISTIMAAARPFWI